MPTLDAPPATDLVWVLACVGWADDLAGWTDDALESDLPARVLVIGSADGEDKAGPRPLGAVLAPVKGDDYLGDRADERFNDARWVAERSLRHDDLISAAMRRGPVFPIAFGSVFRTRDLVRDRVVAIAPAVRRALPKFRGRAEAAVTLLADEGTVTKRIAETHDATGGAVTGDTPHSGSSYLRRKKADRDAKADVRPWSLDRAAGAIDALAALGAEQRDRPVGTAQDDDGLVVRKLALLFDTAREGEIDRATESANAELNADGLTLRVTGPWPPYSFAAEAIDAS